MKIGLALWISRGLFSARYQYAYQTLEVKFRVIINDIRFIKSGFDVAKKIWPKPLKQHMLSRRAGLVRLYLSKNVFEKGKVRGNNTQMGGIAANTMFA